jgi:DNA-binding NtrC family response regulator
MMDDIEREIILETLKKTQNNKAEAARRLRIDRTALYKKLRRHGIAGM